MGDIFQFWKVHTKEFWNQYETLLQDQSIKSGTNHIFTWRITGNEFVLDMTQAMNLENNVDI